MDKATLLMMVVWMLIQQLHLVLVWRRTVEQQRKLDLLSREMLEVRSGMVRQAAKETLGHIAAVVYSPKAMPARDSRGRFVKKGGD